MASSKTEKVNIFLSESILNKYKNKTTPWGFNGLGYIVYKRTYSRLKEDNSYEEWPETILRCINGAQKIGADYTKEEMERLFDYLFNLKCNFAGRMLWQLGTTGIERYGGNSLLNCWFTTISSVDDFCFLFENLMLGGGVGFSVRREDVHELPKVKEGVKIVHKETKDADLIVPDSRQGWVKLLHKTLNSFFYSGRSFTYSTILVRGYGEEIKGFGGTASGPGILVDGIEKIAKILQARENKKIRSIDGLDICNIIGGIVVAGNVRRCLPEYSLIHCKNGLKQIKDINIGDDILTTTGYKKVINKFEQGKQDTLFIKTQDGILECTPKHRVAVLDSTTNYKWIEANKLKSGDRLLSSRISIEGSVTKLPDWDYIKSKHSTTCQDISIPELDEDMAWFLGLFQADGYTFPNYKANGFNAYVSIVGEREYDIAIKIKEQLERFKLKNIILEHRKNENSWIVRCQSKQISWYIDKYIKQAKTELKIPDFIFQAKESIKLAFVCGIFDGDGSNGRPLQLVSTVYKNYALEIQKLLYSCGLESRFSERQDINRLLKGWQKTYRLNIITNHTRKVFVDSGLSLKEIKLKSKTQKANGFPSEWINNHKRKFGLYTNKQLNIDSYDSLFVNNNFCPVEVIEVMKGNKDINTYDIEVETNEFFADGYLVHNSAQVALGDPDDYLFIRAKRWDLGNVPNWRSLSNNSIYADDFSHISNDIWKGYIGNGEPYGFFNVKLSQKTGRLGEHIKDNCEGGNPCMEITLSDKECCNLSELYLNNITSKEELIDCTKLLYKTQKAVCALDFIHEETNKIVHKNFRIGIGVTGICQSMDKIDWLDDNYKAIRKFDKEWSKQKGYPESIKLTTIKPSGTLSLLAGSTPGIHPAYSKYFIRRIRMASSDKLISICEQLGYDTEYVLNFDGSKNYNTVIVNFPCYIGENIIVSDDVGAIEQLELLKKLMTVWADNSISITIYYKESELVDMKKWLEENYKDNIKSVSFLLHKEHGFEQAPYAIITKEEYDKMTEKIKPIKELKIDKSTDLDVEECNGSCPIK